MDVYPDIPDPDAMDEDDRFVRVIRTMRRDEAELYAEEHIDPLGEMLEAVEASIEGTILPPPLEPEPVSLFDDPGWGYPSPPLEPTAGEPHEQRPPDDEVGGVPVHHGLVPPWQSVRRVGRNLGLSRGSSRATPADVVWCPLLDDFASSDVCEDCEYYEEDSDDAPGGQCTYDTGGPP